MSFDLYFIAYQQNPPTAAMAEEIRMQEDVKPIPQLDRQRGAVIEELKVLCPQYEFTAAEDGQQFGGLLACENAECPDVNFWPDHAMTSVGFQSDPEWAQKILVQMTRVFEKHNFAIYDPENEKVWSSAELEAWLPGAVREEKEVVKALEKRRIKKPWWKLW